MSCPPGMQYSACGSPCNATCADLAPVCAPVCAPRCECAANVPVWFPDLGQCGPQAACSLPPGMPRGLPPGLPPAVSVSPAPPRFDCPNLQPAQGANCSVALPETCAYGFFQCPNSSFVTNTVFAVCDPLSATWLLAAVLPNDVCPEPLEALTKAAFQASPSPRSPPASTPKGTPRARPSPSAYGAAYAAGLAYASVTVCAVAVVLLWLRRNRPAGRDGDARPLLAAPPTVSSGAKASQPAWTFRSLSTGARSAERS